MPQAVTGEVTPLVPSTGHGFVRELEGLRAIAIGAVMLHRFWPRSGPAAAYGRVTDLGWMGVDLFFVISGFLIAGILLETKGRPKYFGNFYARRALRIFPLYYLFVGLVLIAFPLAEGGRYFDTSFIRASGSPLWYLLYLGNVREVLGAEPPFFLAPLWSLAIEEQFYLVFPLLVAVLDRRRLTHVLIGAVLFAPVFRVVTAVMFPDNERIQYVATPSRFDEIAIGCLLAIAVRSPRFQVTPRRASLALGVAAAAFLALAATSGFDRASQFGRVAGYSVMALICGAVVLWTVVHRERAASLPLRLPPVMYVGKLCYGLYLLHRPAVFLVEAAVTRGWVPVASDSLLLVPLKVGVSLALASGSWWLFEQPILAFKKRFDRPAARDSGASTPKAQPGQLSAA